MSHAFLTKMANGSPKPAVASVVTVLLALGVLALAPPARAGGDFVDLAVGSGRVWFVGVPGVRELNARTGHTLASPQLVGAPYPLSVALAGGAAWIASVENGYVWGTLTRIDIQTGRRRVLCENRSLIRYSGNSHPSSPLSKRARQEQRRGRGAGLRSHSRRNTSYC